MGEFAMRYRLLAVFTAAWMMSAGLAASAEKGWVRIFDGKTMKGWKASENKDSWTIKDGAFVCHGPRSHLFYEGDGKPFVNFEFKCEVMTTPGSNGGIYFHTKYQETGWPKQGYEVQVNVSHKDAKKTGSLYGVVDVANPPCRDNEYWTQHIIVKGRRIVVKINGKTVVDYTEPEGKTAHSDKFERRVGSGTFALQAHDPKSKVFFKNIVVKRLP
jgi:hypothetical protein